MKVMDSCFNLCFSSPAAQISGFARKAYFVMAEMSFGCNNGGCGWNSRIEKNLRDETRKYINAQILEKGPIQDFSTLRKIVRDHRGDNYYNRRTWQKEQSREATFEYTFTMNENGDMYLQDGKSFDEVFIARYRDLGPKLGVHVDPDELERMQGISDAFRNGAMSLVTTAGKDGNFRYLQKWERKGNTVKMTSTDIALAAGRDLKAQEVKMVISDNVQSNYEKADKDGLVLVTYKKSDSQGSEVFFHKARNYVKRKINILPMSDNVIRTNHIHKVQPEKQTHPELLRIANPQIVRSHQPLNQNQQETKKQSEPISRHKEFFRPFQIVRDHVSYVLKRAGEMPTQLKKRLTINFRRLPVQIEIRLVQKELISKRLTWEKIKNTSIFGIPFRTHKRFKDNLNLVISRPIPILLWFGHSAELSRRPARNGRKSRLDGYILRNTGCKPELSKYILLKNRKAESKIRSQKPFPEKIRHIWVNLRKRTVFLYDKYQVSKKTKREVPERHQVVDIKSKPRALEPKKGINRVRETLKRTKLIWKRKIRETFYRMSKPVQKFLTHVRREKPLFYRLMFLEQLIAAVLQFLMLLRKNKRYELPISNNLDQSREYRQSGLQMMKNLSSHKDSQSSLLHIEAPHKVIYGTQQTNYSHTYSIFPRQGVIFIQAI